MYIARRTGGGRGVYEVAGATATGLTSRDLLGREIVLEMSPGLALPSGVILRTQGGKPRLYMDNGTIQIQRQVAATLMLPSPRRADKGLGKSAQVARTKEYVLERIDLDFVNSIDPHRAYVVPAQMTLKNLADSKTVSLQDRMATVMSVWASADNLPEPLRELVRNHQNLVMAGVPVGADCEDIVVKIQGAAAAAWQGEADSVGDPLGTIVAHLGLPSNAEAYNEETPMSVHAFAFESGFDLDTAMRVPERVRRSVLQRRGRYAFRNALLQAYRGMCQVTQFTGEPALEAAHIYPYAAGGEYTNDLRNGLLLRADIHVLFDLGLVKIAPETLTISVAQPLVGTRYAELQGTTLWTGTVLRPSNEALLRKWEMVR